MNGTVAAPPAITVSPKANSLAIERMRERDEQERMEKMNTKQKRGTPIVRDCRKNEIQFGK